MIAASPVADAEGGAVTGESAKSGGCADRATCVSADGGESRAFLNGRGGTAGGTAREEACIGGLEAIAVVPIFTRDTVGELVQMSFAGDDCAGGAQAGGDPGVG